MRRVDKKILKKLARTEPRRVLDPGQIKTRTNKPLGNIPKGIRYGGL